MALPGLWGEHYGRIVQLAATEDAAAALQHRLEFGLPVIRFRQIEGLGASDEAVIPGVDGGLGAVGYCELHGGSTTRCQTALEETVLKGFTAG